jgi:glucan phosphoethanolaminetransferase (alkaline phosphatase superfamily)
MTEGRVRLLFLWLFLVAADWGVVRGGLPPFEGGRRFAVNYGISAIALYALLILLARLASVGRTGAAASFALLAVPLSVQASHHAVYQTFIGVLGIRTLIEDPAMTLGLCRDNVHIGRTLAAAAICAVAVAWLRLKPVRLGRPWLLASTAVLAIGLPFSALNWYGTLSYQHGIPAAYASLVEVAKTARLSLRYGHRPRVPAMPTSEKLPSMVWVIGESVTLDHLGLYGYERDTTPHLIQMERAGQVVAFTNAISIGAVTRISVPYMLAGQDGVDPDGEIYRRPTLFDYAKARGYTTALITAQELKWGGMERLLVDRSVDLYRSGINFDPATTVLKGADDFLVLQKGAIPFLESVPSPFLLVLQMDGSHYPYSSHSAPAYKKYLPEREQNDINAYDNTLVSSDELLFRLVEAVHRKDPGAWIFFTPDHGQNLISGKRFNLGFSRQIIHNALLVFPPAEGLARLKEQKDTPRSQVDLFATAMDLMKMQPIEGTLDGVSLLRPVDPNRLRVTSGYMATLETEHSAVLVLPDLTSFYVNFTRGHVALPDERTHIPYAEWSPAYRAVFEKRLHPGARGAVASDDR